MRKTNADGDEAEILIIAYETDFPSRYNRSGTEKFKIWNFNFWR